ncbi:MAG: dTDP-4-dehydrorhamnose 3,5-epimerase family protein [Hyphomonadaceae bacterium]
MRVDHSIDGVLVITPEKIPDARGYFSINDLSAQRCYAKLAWATTGYQDNHVFSAEREHRPHCISTAAVCASEVDAHRSGCDLRCRCRIRRASPTYGQHVAIELSAENWKQLVVPAGFAHGYCSLVENTEVVYKVSNHWNGDAEDGVLWSDSILQSPALISPGTPSAMRATSAGRGSRTWSRRSKASPTHPCKAQAPRAMIAARRTKPHTCSCRDGSWLAVAQQLAARM